MDLLYAPTLKVAFHTLSIIECLLYLPKDRGAEVNKGSEMIDMRICKKLLLDRGVSEALFSFILVNSSRAPVTDMEWLSLRAQLTFKTMIAVKEMEYCFKIKPEETDRYPPPRAQTLSPNPIKPLTSNPGKM